MTPQQEAAVAAARTGLRENRPAVVAHEIWWASGLELLLPETILLCAQRCSAIDVLRQRGVEVFCLSEHVDPAAAVSASAVDIFQHPAVIDLCRRLGPLAVIATKPSERLDAAISAANSRLVTPPAALTAARRFENKLAFVDIARDAGVPTPRWEILQPDDATPFRELQARLGSQLVAQAARGNAGQRTWILDGEESLRRVRAAEPRVPLRLAELVPGTPITSTAVAGPSGGPACVGMIEACRQVTGVDWLTPMALGSCGNVWGDPEVQAHQGAVDRAAISLAGALSEAGYRGAFGIDFVTGPSGPVVIETNPRLVASLPLATQMEIEAGRVPLLLRHLLLGLEATALETAAGSGPAVAVEPTDARPVLADLPPLSPAFQVIVRRRGDDASARPETRSGIYGVREGQPPEMLREAAYLTDLGAPDEILVLAREAHEPVPVGKEFARVIGRDAGAERLPGLRDAVAALRG